MNWWGSVNCGTVNIYNYGNQSYGNSSYCQPICQPMYQPYCRPVCRPVCRPMCYALPPGDETKDDMAASESWKVIEGRTKIVNCEDSDVCFPITYEGGDEGEIIVIGEPMKLSEDSQKLKLGTGKWKVIEGRTKIVNCEDPDVCYPITYGDGEEGEILVISAPVTPSDDNQAAPSDDNQRSEVGTGVSGKWKVIEGGTKIVNCEDQGVSISITFEDEEGTIVFGEPTTASEDNQKWYFMTGKWKQIEGGAMMANCENPDFCIPIAYDVGGDIAAIEALIIQSEDNQDMNFGTGN